MSRVTGAFAGLVAASLLVLGTMPAQETTTDPAVPGAIDASRFGESGLWVQASETGDTSGTKGGPLILPGSTITGCWLWIGVAWDARQEAGNVVQVKGLGPDRIHGTADDGSWSNICETFIHNHDTTGGYYDDDVYRSLDVPLTYRDGAVWRIHWQKTKPNVPTGFVARIKMVLAEVPEDVTDPPQPLSGRADPTDGMAQLFPRLWR